MVKFKQTTGLIDYFRPLPQRYKNFTVTSSFVLSVLFE